MFRTTKNSPQYRELSPFSITEPSLTLINISWLVHTLFAVSRKATPRGIKPTPMANSSGNTELAVNIGCQAGNCCCLNFVSVT